MSRLNGQWNVEAVLSNIRDYIENSIKNQPKLQKWKNLIEEKTFVMIEYYVIGLILIAAIMLFTGFGANLVCHAIGFIYPFYFTIKSIETKKDATRWLVYWIVYGFVGILECFISYLLFWIPFFYPAKLTFLLWLMLPQFKGATTIYDFVVKPLFAQLKAAEADIDSILKNVKNDKIYDNTKKKE